MNDVKLSLAIALPGRVMMSGEESPVNSQRETVKVYNDVTKKFENIHITTKKCKPAQQHINICSEAYKDMVSNSTPYGFKGTSFEWKKLKKNEKLLWHMQELAAAMGGMLVNYHIFDD